MARRTEAVSEPRGLVLPAWGYYLTFFVAPLLIIVAYALASRTGFFDIRFGFHTENFVELLDPLYLRIYGNTLAMALAGTLGCLALGYPFSYWLGTRVRRHKTLLLVLVIVPFWTSILIRTYAWVLILSPQGPLSGLLQGVGILGQPLDVLFTKRAIFTGLVYNYLPLMVFPLYVSIERMDRRLVEAARDLGANRWETFRRVTLPVTRAGIITGCLLVFIPMTGEYVVPTILGGAKGALFGPIVADQFLSALDYPFGAAMSLFLVGFLIVVVLAYLRALGRQAEQTLGPVL